MKDRIKINGWFFGALAFAAFALCGGALALSYAFNWNLPNEALILLVGAMAAAGTSFIAMGLRAMESDPPNHHAIAVDHEYRLAQLQHEYELTVAIHQE